MAVPEQTPYIEHIANGVTTSFALEFECKDKEHLIVLVDNVETNVGTWSLVNGAVVFGIAPENGKIITIQRNTPFRRNTNFQSYDNSLRPATINKDFDWVWYKLQELGVADWILGNRIDALKNYVDDRDDELRAYLLEEIHKQGVALDQLEDYYNYLMQRLAQIAVDKGWDASFVVDASGETQQQVNYNGGSKWYSRSGGYRVNERVVLANGDIVKSTVNGNLNDPNSNMSGWVNDSYASQLKYDNGDTVQDVKDRVVYIQDFGGAYNDFDPSVAEDEAKAVANPSSKPYNGARQFAFPMRTLKAWNYLDGYKDRGSVASFRNVANFLADEPNTEILGISSAAGLGDYTDRDAAGLFVQINGQPALHTSTATTFTSNTVACSDLTDSVKSQLRADQIIDVKDTAMTYSGLITAINGNTITVDTAWYTTDGSKTTGTPSNSSQIKIVPNTKVWATNFNAVLTENSDATRMVGIELGMFNNKATASGYGYDVWSGGTYEIGNAYQARGKFNTGLSIAGTGVEFGVTVSTVSNVGYYASNATIGALMQGGGISYVAKDPTAYAFQVQNSSGGFLSGVNKNGQQENLKLSLAVVSLGETINEFVACALINPASAGTVNLPTNSSSMAGHTMYVKNLSSTNAVSLAGAIEGGAGAISLPAKTTIQFISDGTTWYPISKHTF